MREEWMVIFLVKRTFGHFSYHAEMWVALCTAKTACPYQLVYLQELTEGLKVLNVAV